MMAEDDQGSGRLAGQSFPLKVKNTFIDVEESTPQDEIEDAFPDFGRRQVSEPARSMLPDDGSPARRGRPNSGAQAGTHPEIMHATLAPEATENNVMGASGPGPEPMRVPTAVQAWGAGAAAGPGAGVTPSAMLAATAGIPPPEWGATMTVMMRNLPNKYTQRMLLTEVNHSGFLGTFDFLYLPIDPETNANRGYAFLNFIDPSFAWMFKVTFEGRKMNRFNSNKVVSVMPATLQGFEANYAHYASARVNRGDPAARPLFLREPKGVLGASSSGTRRGGRRRGGLPADQLTASQQGAAEEQTAGPWAVAGDGLAISALDAYFGGADFTPAPQAFSPLMPEVDDSGGADVTGSGVGQPLVPKFCPNCGNGIHLTFQFCPNCGSSLAFRKEANSYFDA